MWGINRWFLGGRNKSWKDGKSALQQREDDYLAQEEKYKTNKLRLASTLLADGKKIEYKKLDEVGNSTDTWVEQPTQDALIDLAAHHPAPPTTGPSSEQIASTLQAIDAHSADQPTSIEVSDIPWTDETKAVIPQIAMMTFGTLIAIDAQENKIRDLATRFEKTTWKTISALIMQPNLFADIIKNEEDKQLLEELIKELQQFQVSEAYYGWLGQSELAEYGKAITRMKNFAMTNIYLQRESLIAAFLAHGQGQ